MVNLGVVTTVEIDVSIIDANNEITSLPQAGNITVQGELEGPVGREVILTADESSSLGYRFREWRLETQPITLVPVNIGGYTQTIQEMCNPDAPQTDLSNIVYTDGNFFYTSPEGNIVSPSGYYGAGANSYYYHDTLSGITGPVVCSIGTNPSRPRPDGAPGVPPSNPTPGGPGTPPELPPTEE